MKWTSNVFRVVFLRTSADEKENIARSECEARRWSGDERAGMGGGTSTVQIIGDWPINFECHLAVSVNYR